MTSSIATDPAKLGQTQPPHVNIADTYREMLSAVSDV